MNIFSVLSIKAELPVSKHSYFFKFKFVILLIEKNMLCVLTQTTEIVGRREYLSTLV